jgi:protein-tyrosine-phosphatase/tRNA A37 threonylcarbamoyladenosine synthetase subunit TsaC/SUA5/YrdC
MTKILDWKRAEDPRDVIHLAVQALAEGHLVAFPSESSYFIAASSLRPTAVQNLQVIVDERTLAAKKNADGAPICPAAIVPRSAGELLDFIPDRSKVASRLAERLWPGPVKFRLKTEHASSVIAQLNSQVQLLVRDAQGYVGFVLPHHESLEEVVRLSIGPLMVANLATQPIGTETVGANSVDGRVALVIDDGLARSPSPWTMLRIDGQRATVERQGTWSAEQLVSRSQMKILLVCTGNTCRSPMAEMLMKRKLKLRFPEHFANTQLSPINVISAGVSAYPGGPASDGAIAAMASCGIDLSKHESQPTSESLVEQADLILTMTNSHRHTLLGRWPHLMSKTFGLAPNHGDVSDPYGGSLEIYQQCAKAIDQYLEAWIDRFDRDTLPIWGISGTSGCV